MLRPSLRGRHSIIRLIVVVILASPAMDGGAANAQGLLRRIQDRIQSRNQPTYQPRQAEPQLRPAPPQTRVLQTQSGPTAATSPLRRVSPVAAPGSRDALAAEENDLENDFGRSILADSGNSEADADSPTATRATIGISVYESEDDALGVVVGSIREDSLADEAGLRVGDDIYAVNGRRTESSADVAKQLRGFEPGDRVSVQIYRNRRPAMLAIPLIDRRVTTTQVKPKPLADEPTAMTAQAQQKPSANRSATASGLIDFGVVAETLPTVRGALIKDVQSDSPAELAGIVQGDRIVSVNGRLLMDSDALSRKLDGRTKGDQVTLQLVRDAKLVAVEVGFDTPESNKLKKSELAKSKSQGGDAEGSLTTGLGSMLGGLFGGKKEIPSADNDEMAFDDGESVQPVTFEAPTNQGDAAKLDDAAKQASAPKSSKKSDPPSLEMMELPAGTPEPIATPKATEDATQDVAEKAQSDEVLRRRIEALEAELNRLKAAE